MRPASRRHLLIGTAALAAVPRHARAASLPDRALRILVPFPAGGPSDIVVRIFADAMRPLHPAGVIVENKPGGAGTIAVRASLASPADSLTLVVGNNQTHATAPFLIKDAGYDPLRDFRPLARIAEWPHVLVVRERLGVTAVADLIARAKADPGRLTCGSTGPGSGSHLAAELFQHRTGTRLQIVPYQNAQQMVLDIAAERLDMGLAISTATTAASQSERLKYLAVAAPARLDALPHIPTLAEAGVPGAEAMSWLGFFTPARTDDSTAAAFADLVSRAHAKLLARDAVLIRLPGDLGIVARIGPAADFRDFLGAEITRWGDLIRMIGLQPE